MLIRLERARATPPARRVRFMSKITGVLPFAYDMDAELLPDAVLVQRARRGDLLAQGALFRRYCKVVYRLSHHLVGCNDADDLLQDGFVAAFAQLDRLREPKAFSVWLSAIVVRTAHKCLRRRQLLERLGLRRRTPVEIDFLASRAAPPEIAAEVRRIYAVVKRMPEEARLALQLRRIEGLSLNEIAEKMDRSLATIKRRLAQAQEIMNKKLADPPGRDEPGSLPR